jgi:hypothetical protein
MPKTAANMPMTECGPNVGSGLDMEVEITTE